MSGGACGAARLQCDRTGLEVSVPQIAEQLFVLWLKSNWLPTVSFLLFGDAIFYVAVMTDQCEWRNFLCAGSLSMRNRVPPSQSL